MGQSGRCAAAERAAKLHDEELWLAAEKHDEKLFKEPPSQYGDCSICFQQLPTLDKGRRYMTCCGKTICGGCIYAPVYDNQGNEVAEERCALCRNLFPKSEEEIVERKRKRAEAGDARAIYNQGCD